MTFPFDVLLVAGIYTLMVLIWAGIIVAIVAPIILMIRLFQRVGDHSVKLGPGTRVLVRAHKPHHI